MTNKVVVVDSNSVMRFRHASYYLGQYIASQGKTLQEKYLVSEQDYVVHGGAFPLIIKDVGVIGTVTVSGLAQQVWDSRIIQQPPATSAAEIKYHFAEFQTRLVLTVHILHRTTMP